MGKLLRERRPILKSAVLFVALAAIYYCWMTGFTFRFSETILFPTYDMLAGSFLKGQLNIDENPPEDYLSYQGKRYLYFGPAPALFHMPSLILAGRQTPTGLMVIIYLAATAVVFSAILKLWREPEDALRVEIAVFSLLFAFNGYSWLMATIPSIHHEAICAGIFFLLFGVYYVLKSAKHAFELDLGEAVVSGTCFCLCLLSRFSYAFTVIAMALTMIVGNLTNYDRSVRIRSLLPVFVLAFLTLAGLAGTLEYNYLRFGNPADFGVSFMETVYRDYFSHGNYLRYDHIPLNVWDYFFRIPQLDPEFPYLKLPFYILEATTFQSEQDYLMHVNELSVSIFALMPVLLFCLFCSFRGHASESKFGLIASRIVLGAFLLQMVPLSLTIGSIARYEFDFLPFLLVLAFAGYVGIKRKLSSNYFLLGLTSGLSLLLSFSVPMCALIFYLSNINFRSPLLQLW